MQAEHYFLVLFFNGLPAKANLHPLQLQKQAGKLHNRSAMRIHPPSNSLLTSREPINFFTMLQVYPFFGKLFLVNWDTVYVFFNFRPYSSLLIFLDKLLFLIYPFCSDHLFKSRRASFSQHSLPIWKARLNLGCAVGLYIYRYSLVSIFNP